MALFMKQASAQFDSYSSKYSRSKHVEHGLILGYNYYQSGFLEVGYSRFRGNPGCCFSSDLRGSSFSLQYSPKTQNLAFTTRVWKELIPFVVGDIEASAYKQNDRFGTGIQPGLGLGFGAFQLMYGYFIPFQKAEVPVMQGHNLRIKFHYLF